MAGENRSAPDHLEVGRRIEPAPYRFGFYRALRLLECANREKPRIGRSARASGDPVRFGQEPSLAFAPSTLASFESGRDGSPSRLLVYFFGLFGPNGPLPLHLTEYARARSRNFGDPTFARFVDLFHHRMLSLFYRAWASAQPTVNFDRPETDRFALYVGSLFGLGMPSLRDRDDFSDLAKLHYAGLLGGHTRHAAGLEGMLRDFFEVPVSIEQFVGQWIELPEASRCRLGQSPASATLGDSAIAGARIWDCQQKFRIALGPLSFADYERFLPGSLSLSRLASVVRSYLGDELACEVKLVLKREEAPPARLGRTGRLGWTTWCLSRPLERDPDELHLKPLDRTG